MDHQKINCPKPRRTVAVVATSAQSSISDLATPSADYFSDTDDLTIALSRIPWVSVSFEHVNGLFSKSYFLRSLIDTDSPSSFVHCSMIPKDFPDLPAVKSNYYGINNTPIFIQGRLNCRVRPRNQVKTIRINIVKDDVILRITR